jgi:hypothetical protein
MVKSKKILAFIFLISLFALPQMAFGGNSNPALDKLNNVATVQGPYKADATILGMVGAVVGVALGLVGTIFLLLMIFAGYNWMTAEGQEEKVTKAKDTIIRASIGIAIVVGAFAAWKFVFSKLF